MPVFLDQLYNSIEMPVQPVRIVSLVPSITELLYSLQLSERVVGITKFCVHPESWFREKTRIGGTKTIKMDVIHLLQPDLIIANKEENVEEQVRELQKNYRVWVSDVINLSNAIDMITQIGAVTGTHPKAFQLVQQIAKEFLALKHKTIDDIRQGRILRTGYLIWRDPYMTVGRGTFIHDMLTRCGFENIFDHTTRYPTIDIQQLRDADCELLLLSSEPYPFKQKHIDELQPLLPDTKIMLVDGEMFSWYGSRLLQAPAYFASLLEQLQ